MYHANSVPETLHTIHLDSLPPRSHALVKISLYGTDTAARAAVDDTKHCHKQEARGVVAQEAAT